MNAVPVPAASIAELDHLDLVRQLASVDTLRDALRLFGSSEHDHYERISGIPVLMRFRTNVYVVSIDARPLVEDLVRREPLRTVPWSETLGFSRQA